MSIMSTGLGDHERRSLQRKTYTVEEAGRLLGMSRNAAYRAAKAGTLPGLIRIGRRLFVSRAALDLLLERGGVEAAA